MAQGLKSTNDSSALMGEHITISEVEKLTNEQIDLLPPEKVREAASEILKLRATQVEHAIPSIPREYTESLLAQCIDYSQKIEASKMQPGLDVSQILDSFIEIGIRVRGKSIDKLDPDQTNKFLTDYLRTTTNVQLKVIAESDPQKLKTFLKGFAHSFESVKGIDVLEHDAVMKMPANELRALLISRTGRSAFFYRQFAAEEYHAPAMIEKYGNAEAALKKVMGYLWTLESLIENENFPDVPIDWDPIMHTTVALLRKKWGKTVPLEARFEATVQAQVSKIATEMYNIRPDLVKHAKKIVEYKKQVDDLSKILQVLGEKHVGETKDKNDKIKQLNEAKNHLEKEIIDYKGKETYAKTVFDRQLGDLAKELGVIKSQLADSVPKGRYESLHNDFENATAEIKNKEAGLDLAKEENTKLANKVVSLETENAILNVEKNKELSDKLMYQGQSIKVQANHNEKEKELIQKNEQLKFERAQKEEARTQAADQKKNTEAEKKRADDLENKLRKVHATKWGVIGGAAVASFLAAGLIFYHPSQPVTQSEPVPEKVINYVPSKDEMIVTFGKDTYKLSADTFSNIYKEIQRDEQKANRKFLPAEEKKYFDSKTDKVRIIK